MGICFSSYGNESYSRYTLYISLYSDTAERQKVVDETTFYFAKLNDDGSYVMTDINITGFNMSDTSYYFNNIVAPSEKYILVSQNGEILGYKKSNGAIEKIVLNEYGGQYTLTNVLLYSIPDYATILYGNNTHLIINVPKEEREANIALYGSEVKVYDGMTAETNWAHPYTADDVYKTRIKSVSFGSVTKPTTLREAFDGLQLCHTIDLTNLDTTDCESFRSTFQMCKELVNMDITKLIVTDKCTSLAGIFNNCMKYVINSDLLHWDTSNVVYFGTAFGNIGNTEFSPKIDTSSGQSFNSMFGYSPNIEVLDLSTFDTSNATDIGFMFIRCENLTTIYAKPTLVAPDGVSANRIFDFDTKLVGGGGTTYDQAHISTTRFYIDNPPSQLGYFTDKDASTFKTTLFTDGTLIMNEDSTHRATNILTHGAVVAEYDPMDANHNYVFTAASQVPWHGQNVKSVKFDSIMQPTSTAYWFYQLPVEDFDWDRLDTSKVTHMDYMFMGCTSLTSLDLSSFNTARVVDMTGMFGSTGLTSIDLSGFDTTNVTDMDFMFQNSAYLTEINQDFNTSNVEHMAHMFDGCTAMTSLYCPDWDVSSVRDMTRMFAGCNNLGLYQVWTWNTSSLEMMDEMFMETGTLVPFAHLDVQNWDISNVTSMKGIFNGSGVARISLDNWDTHNVTNMNSMFASCHNLTELDLREFDTANVTNMANMFNNCINLVTIKTSDYFETGLVTQSNGMFSFCTSIVGGAGTVYDPMHQDKGYARKDEGTSRPGYFTGEAVTLMTTLYTDGTFIINEKSSDRDSNIALHGAVTNEYAPLSDTNTYVFANAAARPWNAQVTSITSVEFGYATQPTSTAYWFNGCTNLASLNFTRLDTSNVTNMNNMFSNCKSLTSLDVSNWNTGNVTIMNGMFSYCDNLTSLDLSSWNTSNVTTMVSMFSYCSNLTSLDVSNWDTGSVRSMATMFFQCTNLTSLDLSSWDTSNVTNMDRLFYNCQSLTSLDLSSWDTSNITNMNYMFYHCNNLTSLDLSSWNTSNVTTMVNMFTTCKSLTSLDVSNWDLSNVTAMNSMFHSCSNLIQLNIGVSNTGYNSSLNSNQMFYDCSELRTLQINGNSVLSLSNSNALTGLKSTCQIKVPAELVDSYKTATNWSARASYIQAIA